MCALVRWCKAKALVCVCKLRRSCDSFSALGAVASREKRRCTPHPSPLTPQPSSSPLRPSPLRTSPSLHSPPCPWSNDVFFLCLRLCVHAHVRWVHAHVHWARVLPHSVRRVQEVDGEQDLMDPAAQDLCVQVTPIHTSEHIYKHSREGGTREEGQEEVRHVLLFPPCSSLPPPLSLLPPTTLNRQ